MENLHFTEREKVILARIRNEGPIARVRIAKKEKISKPVVTLGVRKLLSVGAVREVGKDVKRSSKGGKQATLLGFVPDFRLTLAVDIGRTKIVAAMIDLDGDIRASHTVSHRENMSKEEFRSLLFEAIGGVTEVVPKEKIIGIGVGIPGVIGSNNGVADFIPVLSLRNVPIKSWIEERFEIETFCENDAALQALSESWKGVAKGKKNVVVINLGAGIGSGVIIDGRLYTGSTGRAGELGYLISNWDNTYYRESFFGELEEKMSGVCLERKLDEFGYHGFTATDLFERDIDDERLRDLIYQGCKSLALALCNLISILNPDIVVMTGGIGYNQFELLTKYTIPLIRNILPNEFVGSVEFARSKFPSEGVLIGAGYLVQKKAFL